MKIIDVLKSNDVFRDIDPNLFERFGQYFHESFHEVGQAIFFQGEPCDRLRILIDGAVCLSFSAEDGREVIVCELYAGDMLGEMELLSRSKYLANCLAGSSVRMVSIDRRIFEQLLTFPSFSAALLRTISRRLQQSMMFAEGMSLHSLEARLARLLLSMSVTYGRRMSDGVMIDRSLSQSLIGQMVNASRPRINIQLQSWKNGKLIHMGGNRITILDEPALRAISRLPRTTEP